GFDLVRRPTGGKAILHAHEVTYSVIRRLQGAGLREMYRQVNEGLLAGLALLGVHAELSCRSDDFRSLKASPEFIPCFSSTAGSEILFQGRKLVGSAQRRFGDVVLQHGSILLDGSHREIAECLAPRLEGRRHEVEELLESHSVDLESILG